MFQVSVEQYFDAAHFLRGYQGKCEALHGHRFRVVVRVDAAGVDEIGMAYDFTVLKKHLSVIMSKFDHTSLNDVQPFDKMNPSSENIASTIYEELRPRLTETPVTLNSVEVWETPNQGASYCPD